MVSRNELRPGVCDASPVARPTAFRRRTSTPRSRESTNLNRHARVQERRFRRPGSNVFGPSVGVPALWRSRSWRNGCRTALAVLSGLCLLAGGAGCSKEKYRKESAEAYHEEAQRALGDGDCWKAEQLFRSLLSDFPGSHLVDDAQFGIAQASYCSEDYVTSIFEYERLLDEYPASPFVDEARYQIGMCHYRESKSVHHDQEDTHKAIRVFRRFIEDYPRSPLVSDAEKRIRELRDKLASHKLVIAQNYFRWKRPKSAQIYCEVILEEFPDSRAVPRARFTLARIKRSLGDLDEALALLRVVAQEDLSVDLKEKVFEEIREVEQTLAKRKSSGRMSAQEGRGELGAK